MHGCHSCGRGAGCGVGEDHYGEPVRSTAIALGIQCCSASLTCSPGTQLPALSLLTLLASRRFKN